MQYDKRHIELGKRFLSNENVNLDYDVDVNEYTDGTKGRDEHLRFDIHVGERIWTDGTSIWATGNRDEEDYRKQTKGAVKGVVCEGLSLCATRYNDDDNENDWSGGLEGNCYYDGSGKDGTWNDGTDEDTGVLINRWTGADSDGLIYTDDGFTANLDRYLRDKCDLADELRAYLDYSYSEQGMQQAGVVNFDVDMDGDFWLHCAKELGILTDAQ